MKKILSFTLALLMAMVISASACAADVPAADSAAPDGSESQIEPRAGLYHLMNVPSGDNAWESPVIPMQNGQGRYVRYWFRNKTDGPVHVSLHTKGLFGKKEVSRIVVAAQSGKSAVYQAANEKENLVVYVETSNAAYIQGEVAVAQYRYHP